MSVLFFAHDPGGANAIAPLILRFDNPLVFGKGPALKILPNAKPLPDNALTVLMPDFLITGTSAIDFTERHLWRDATGLSIPSMAILDAWVNYGVRFSRFSTREIHLFDGVCDYLPDYICVMDDLAKAEMHKEGVPYDRIIALGNPHFENVFLAAAQTSPTTLSKKRIVLFASEPFEDVYRKGAEEAALRDLIKVAEQYDDVAIRIRKHPREPEQKHAGHLNEHVEMDNIADSLKSIEQSEIVVSVSSMLLIEAMFFGKKVISYQPKSKDGKNDFILTRNGTLPFLQNYEELNSHFKDVLNGCAGFAKNKITHQGIIDNITSFIKERLNG